MSAPPGLRLAGTAAIGETPVFGPLDLTISAGTWSCLLGPSGCGKSTILRLLAGLETGVNFSGEITASDGQPIPPRVAWMAQSDLLLPWLDISGNIALGAKLRGTVVDEARMGKLIARLGLDGHAHKRPAQLSGGQRQRVALARTLMEDRPIVLLDEPFSALDARTRAEMQELSAEVLAGRTVLIVTHDPGEAARLGTDVWLMTAQRLDRITPPSSPAIRAADDPDTLAFQARLLASLRAAA